MSIFLYIGHVKISCGLLPTRFFLKFYKNYCSKKKGEISGSLLGKINYVIRKVIQNYIQHTVVVIHLFLKFLSSYERLQMFFQTSAWEICTILGLFHILKLQ